MPQSRPAGDSDRLPWLEPYREPPAKGGRLPRRGYGKPLVLGGAIGLAIAAAAGGYWLGQGGAPEPVASDTVVIPPARPEPVPIAEAPKPEAAEPKPVEVETPAASTKSERRSAQRGSGARPSAPSKRWLAEKRRIRAQVEWSRLRAVRAAQERRAAARAWPKMPSPGPAGQVIQLGAFTTAARARAAYARRTARYPLLSRMPVVVVPVISKPSRRVLYVLRLGTSSRQQSKTVCRNLVASGDHCLVIG